MESLKRNPSEQLIYPEILSPISIMDIVLGDEVQWWIRKLNWTSEFKFAPGSKSNWTSVIFLSLSKIEVRLGFLDHLKFNELIHNCSWCSLKWNEPRDPSSFKVTSISRSIRIRSRVKIDFSRRRFQFWLFVVELVLIFGIPLKGLCD